MTLLYQDLSPFLVAVIIAAVMWFVRMGANNRARDRARQLAEAAELLKFHAITLARFLDDPVPDVELKRLLIRFSDAMTDRATVEKLTAWSASRAFAQSLEETDETLHIDRSLTFLRTRRPDLGDDFGTAILTAAAGACLRWPESAALFDRAFSRLAVTPRRDVVIAVTARNFRRDLPFSLRPAAATG